MQLINTIFRYSYVNSNTHTHAHRPTTLSIKWLRLIGLKPVFRYFWWKFPHIPIMEIRYSILTLAEISQILTGFSHFTFINWNHKQNVIKTSSKIVCFVLLFGFISYKNRYLCIDTHSQSAKITRFIPEHFLSWISICDTDFFPKLILLHNDQLWNIRKLQEISQNSQRNFYPPIK